MGGVQLWEVSSNMRFQLYEVLSHGRCLVM